MPMIQLVQFPFSPFCIVTRRILEYARAPIKITNIPVGDRSVVWKMTKERYYQVPVIRDGRQVIFETGDESQVIAKYIDQKFELGLFPRELRGIQNILWRHVEEEVEGAGFKLNDAHYEEFVPKNQRASFIRHKERKFGRGCLQEWAGQKKQLLAEFTASLEPYEQMLSTRSFLLDEQPRFLDFDLFGMIGNFLYTGRNRLPKQLTRICEWRQRMAKIKLSKKSA